MSYESKINNRGEITGSLEPHANNFLRPTPLALLASVILHLLVYKFGLPNFSFNTNPTKREVSIVELTPEQQSRLPNLYPELYRQPEIPGLENLPTDTDNPAPPFALPPSLTPGIEGFPNLPPVSIPLPPKFDIPPLPPLPNTKIELPPIGDLSTLPPPPSVESFNLPETQTETSPTPSEPPPEEKPEPSAPPPEEKSESEASEPETQPSSQEIAARRQQNLHQEVSSISSSLQKQNDATTNEDARKNYVAWLNRVKAIAPENIEIEGTYPRDACIRRLEGTSVFGVVVDASGRVVASDLLKGAQYPVFDLQGSNDLAEVSLENDTEKPKPYRVTLNYQYDSEICPSLTLPSLRREEKTDAPQPKTPKTPIENETEASPSQAEDTLAPEAETPETTTTESERSQPQPEDAPASETPTSEEPSLRERLRDVPLLPKERFSSPAVEPQRSSESPSQAEDTPAPEVENPETTTTESERSQPQPEDAPASETPTSEEPSLRERLRDVPLLPKERFSSPAVEPEHSSPNRSTATPETSNPTDLNQNESELNK
ncbi:energy transducer TonB [Myxosarcina sp. GI1(2024)]